ncbi:MAG: C25 family cysteine peptidase [Candidatus Thermoplasmatota archaeon]|nr:C25 family cysteine peptidase [Candidatus Thermoplasmatota archaeon]
MKKCYVLIIIGIVVLSGFVSAGISQKQEQIRKETKMVTFSAIPSLIEKDGYLSIDLLGTNTFIDKPGNPNLPVSQTVFEFPKNTMIHDVSVRYSTILTEAITGKIIPASQSVPVSKNYCAPTSCFTDVSSTSLLVENQDVYQNNDLFPAQWFDYSIKCGLNDAGEQTTFVIVSIYPIRYQPSANILQYISDAEIQIRYSEPETEIGLQTVDSYDLLIIAPEVFVDPLQPLLSHKQSIGVKTTLKTVEEILIEYSGRDQPEQIKYFIKDAKENWDITYVLLVGGLKSYLYAKDKEDCNHGSTRGWHVPVRYTNIRHSNEVGVISDLYYSDIYRYNLDTQQWEFEDWDSNGDNIFASGGVGGAKDDLDLIPDLYIGRLACRTKIEVDILVRKIITYESTSQTEKPWYGRMIGVAGRTFSLFDGSDQRQTTSSDCQSLVSFEWQEFIPRKDVLSRVELKLQSLDPTASDIVMSLERPLGTVVASIEKSASDIPSTTSDWVSFDLQDVKVIPFETYYITVTVQGSGYYSWCYAEPSRPGISRYPLGNSSLGDDLDWCFKTYDLPEGIQKPDGEYSVDAAFRYMEPITTEEIRVYWSNEGTGGPVPDTQDIIDAFNLGSGYINMEGHGNPLSWATHPVPDDAPFTGGISITDFPQLKNGDELPVVVVGGCHNALFNVSLIRTLIGRPHENWYWTSGYITPISFCWALCASPKGGAIASIGCTGLGLGGTPPDLKNSGGLDVNFFYKVGNGVSTLGQAHSGAIQKYVLENKIDNDGMFCIVEFHLFGDPSLYLGGFE